MNGTQPIVVNITKSHQFFEHESIDAAKLEAHRLAAKQDEDVFVVYVPIAVVRRTRPTAEELTRFSVDEALPF